MNELTDQITVINVTCTLYSLFVITIKNYYYYYYYYHYHYYYYYYYYYYNYYY